MSDCHHLTCSVSAILLRNTRDRCKYRKRAPRKCVNALDRTFRGSCFRHWNKAASADCLLAILSSSRLTAFFTSVSIASSCHVHVAFQAKAQRTNVRRVIKEIGHHIQKSERRSLSWGSSKVEIVRGVHHLTSSLELMWTLTRTKNRAHVT